MQTPDITPAQIVSSILAVVGLLVTQGAVSNGTGKLVGGLAAIVIPFGWQLADAIIRHGRSKVAAAQATPGTPIVTSSEGGVTWQFPAGASATVADPTPEVKPPAARKRASSGRAR